MTWQQVYWITRLDALHTLLVAIAVLSFLSCIVFMAVGAAIYDSWYRDPDHIAHDHAVSKKWFK